jgi:hypothetical protein
MPGISVIPLTGNRALLALEAGRGMADLELAIIDRLDDVAVDSRERMALRDLRRQLREWRQGGVLRFHPRAIIVVERLVKRRRAARSLRRPRRV